MSWHKSEDGKYSAFASDLDAFIDAQLKSDKPRDVKCPVCQTEIQFPLLFSNPQRVGEEPTAMFKSKCLCCQTVLTVFND